MGSAGSMKYEADDNFTNMFLVDSKYQNLLVSDTRKSDAGSGWFCLDDRGFCAKKPVQVRAP